MTPIPVREAQAMREVGLTDVGQVCARALTVVFLIIITSVPLLELYLDDSEAENPAELVGELALSGVEALSDLRSLGVLATNRLLMAAMAGFDTRLQESSFLTRQVLPPVQWTMTRVLGLGNEQAYLGDAGWLFYRPDVDYVVGRGFLEPAVLQARRRQGEAWVDPEQPDPLAALADLRRQLGSTGIRLLVVPTPVKPSVHPENFSYRMASPKSAIQNPSFEEFLARAAATGIELFDPAPILVESKFQTGEPQYLRTDTHWTPRGLGRVAEELAVRVRATLRSLEYDAKAGFVRQSVTLEGMGDIAKMLWVPARQGKIPPDRVQADMITSPSGQVWRSSRSAEILLLGDSFTNVFSDPALGWGVGAGLAEQLSFYLGMPIDRIARNAGGALGSRQALREILLSDPGRLEGKRLVIYQFSARELAQGDWRIVDLGVNH